MAPPTPAPPFTKTTHHDIYPAISPAPDGALVNSAKGLTVLVSGAGRGIGRAEAIVFAQAGAKKVVIAARSTNELSEVEVAIKGVAPKTEVIKVETDVMDEKSVAALFHQAGEVHVLINNAGTGDTSTRIHEADPEEWWRTYEVNVKGTFLLTREALRHCLGSGERTRVNLTIINTSSIGSMSSILAMSSYQSSKSAVNRFTEFIHFEYEEEGVRTFAFHPGGVATKLSHSSLPEDMHKELTDTPELAAGYALWLATSGSKVDFLRGRYSSADWDVNELISRQDEIVGRNLLWTRVVGQEQIHA